MGGPNLEVFKFGMYIMFPIGWMYYFGTNLDNKFTVKDFWPTKEQLNKIPTERDEIQDELARLRRKRLQLRQQRLEEEALEHAVVPPDDIEIRAPVRKALLTGGPLDQMGENAARAVEREGRGWMDWLRGR